jgi:hypothetical protein
MSFATEQVARIDTLLAENSGVKSVMGKFGLAR